MDAIPEQSDKNEEPSGVKDLLGVARGCVAEWDLVEFPYRVASDWDNAFRVGLPLCAHALNCVRVALDVWYQLPWVATANARVAFEHAFVAQWAFLTPDGPQHFIRHAAHSNLVQAQDLARVIAGQPELTALLSDDELASFQAFVDQEPAPGHERSWNLADLFSRFEASGLRYGSYRALSSAVHPTTGTIAAHLDLRGDGPPRVQRDGALVVDRSEAEQGLALAGLWALNLIEKCAPDYSPPGRAGLIAIPNELPYDLAHSDRNRAN